MWCSTHVFPCFFRLSHALLPVAPHKLARPRFPSHATDARTESVHLMSFQLRRHKLCGFSRAETPESPVQPAEEKYSFKETNCCVLLDLHKSLWECGGNKKSNKNSIRNSAAVLFVRPNNPGRSVNSFLQQMWDVPEEEEEEKKESPARGWEEIMCKGGIKSHNRCFILAPVSYMMKQGGAPFAQPDEWP